MKLNHNGRPKQHGLSWRQKEILRRIARSWSFKQIAHQFKLTVKGVYYHFAEIQRRLNVYGRNDLTRFAVTWGLIK